MTATFSERAIEAGKTAMEAKRSELQHLPLARIYGDLTQAALTSALAVDGLALVREAENIRWARVNGEPFEYAIQQGRFGDEFVKLLDETCLRRPLTAASDGEVG